MWVDKVRKCLMTAIRPYYKGMHTCADIKRLAFESHVDCYVDSGFCDIATNPHNWDALSAVYEFFADFIFGEDIGAAWRQVNSSVVHTT